MRQNPVNGEKIKAKDLIPVRAVFPAAASVVPTAMFSAPAYSLLQLQATNCTHVDDQDRSVLFLCS